MSETLRCRCGIEVGIVRLNPETLRLGHKVNPKNNRHAVRLARDAAVAGGSRTSGVPQLASNPSKGAHAPTASLSVERTSPDVPSGVGSLGRLAHGPRASG